MSRTPAHDARASGIPTMLWGAFLLLAIASWPAMAQRDTTRGDTTTKRTRADSARIADSIAVVRELERIRAEPRAHDPGRQQPPQGAPSNPRLLPDISAVGDLIGDLSPKGSTQEGGERFSVREVEVALQAAVDPYFRGDVFFGVSDLEKISIEQAYHFFQETLLDLQDITVLPYTAPAEALFQEWRQQKLRIATHDLRIAAICVAHSATLISRNRRDFERVPGLRVEYWE